MRIQRSAAIVSCLSALAACAAGDRMEAVPPEGEAQAVSQLEGAAVYECTDGTVLQVRFNRQPASASVLLEEDLNDWALSEHAEFETYTLADMSLVVGPDDARLVRSGSAVECDGVSRSVPPPGAPDVVRDLRSADAGSTLDIATGERFSVSLVGVPTAGYEWAPTGLPTFLKLVDEAGGVTSTAQYLPGYTGGNHWEVLVFEAREAGAGDLVLEQRRPWEDESEPAVDSFRVTVTAR